MLCALQVDMSAFDGVKVAMIAAGAFHNIALTTLGDVFTWGTND